MILLLIIASLTFINVNLPQLCPTMGTTTRAMTAKKKPTRTAITPKPARRSTRPSQSPRSDKINSLLAEINLPTSRFNNVLEELHPSMRQDSQMDDDLDDPCNLTLPTDKTNQITPLASPTGVNQALPPQSMMLWLPKPTNLYKANPPHQPKGYVLTKPLSQQKLQ